MTTKDYQKKSPLMIFLSYFKNHKGLFAVDVLCACGIAGIDLMFPLVTRSALYDMLPGKMYQTFFTVMVTVLLCYVLRSFLQFIVPISATPLASGWRRTSVRTCSPICRR